LINSLKKFLNHFAFSLFYFLLTLVIYYQFIHTTIIQEYWVGIPLLLYVLSISIDKFINKRESNSMFFSIVALISLIISFISLKNEKVNNLFLQNFDIVSFLIIVIFLLNIIIIKNNRHNKSFKEDNKPEKALFNLFYINTSKVHEITMLIDNKIMRTIEKERSSEEVLQNKNELSIGGVGNWKSNLGHSKNQSTKKSVYENFDVKMTKSNMLQKIYANINKNKKSERNLKLGDIFIFEDIELQPINIKDTVMILNILQDSKIKTDPSEEIEINFNEMLDRMLDDFTVDYKFTHGNSEKNYLLQIPYKDTENFENGYQHNDLQLGKLSLIGIYRGKIDFKQKESISSKFMELMSESFENERQQTESNKMLNSNTPNEQINEYLDFKYEKLQEEFYLIDVIAIVQDLNID